jgi:GR25 family glycosyltransferase involved in LPS biosynthesis
MINTIVDKIFCINLDRRPDRWAKASVQFEKHGLYVQRFSAIDKNDFKREYPMDNANNGCTLSHYFIVERAKLLGWKAVMIFEDDVVLHDDFMNQFNACMKDVPEDWELIYFGGSHRCGPHPVTEKIFRVNKTLTTHAYIIRESMYDFVIENFKKLDEPVDCFYTNVQGKGTSYITNPPIAWQREGHSDIVGRTMNYDWIKTNNQ